MKNFALEPLIKKLMLIFLILTITAASFCGFFVKWAFRDGAPRFGFVAYMENTGTRPAVYRQLIPQMVKSTSEIIPAPTKEKLSKRLIEKRYIEDRYARAEIPPKYVIEYYLMFIYSFLFFFAAIWLLRALLISVTQDEVAGTLGAMLFALIFPYFEVLGGYFYDLGEVFFFFLAAILALKGKFFALIVLAPIATVNKEAFFFFLMTLFPLLRVNFGVKKSAAVVLVAMFFSGLAYLFVRETFAANPGGAVEWHHIDHLENLFNISSYFLTDSIYGVPLPSRMFLLHIIYVIFIVKSSWQNLNDTWKLHAKIALAVNGVLYIFFVVPNEIRDLSMLYISLILLTTYFIRDIFLKNYGKEKLQ